MFYVPPDFVPPATGERTEIVCPVRVSNGESLAKKPEVIRAVEVGKRPVAKVKIECTPESLARDNVPIASIEIPRGWRQTRRSAKWAYGGNSGYAYEFVRRQGKSSAVFSIDWDGRFVEPQCHAAWREILTGPPHKLDAEEIEFLHRVLYISEADPERFRLDSAKTVAWGGRIVIEIEGETIASDNPGVRMHAIVFDNYGDFRCAGQVSFSAEPENFVKLEPAGLKIMRSIVWAKQEPGPDR